MRSHVLQQSDGYMFRLAELMDEEIVYVGRPEVSRPASYCANGRFLPTRPYMCCFWWPGVSTTIRY